MTTTIDLLADRDARCAYLERLARELAQLAVDNGASSRDVRAAIKKAKEVN